MSVSISGFTIFVSLKPIVSVSQGPHPGAKPVIWLGEGGGNYSIEKKIGRGKMSTTTVFVFFFKIRGVWGQNS